MLEEVKPIFVAGQFVIPIPEWSRYRISGEGFVWDTKRKRWLVRSKHKGYLRVWLRQDGAKAQYLIHQLVALAWIGPPPFVGAYVLHEDDIQDRNLFLYLRYGTHKDNLDEAYKTGRRSKDRDFGGIHHKGEDANSAKLTNAQVLEIRARLANGEIGRRLAEEFGVDWATVSYIKKRKTFKDI